MLQPHSSLPPIVHPVSPRDYHAIDAKIPRGNPAKTMSRSELKETARNLHRWLMGYREEDTDAKADGHVSDIITLIPDRFESLYAVTPETYPCEPTKKDPRSEKPWNWNATFCDLWRAERKAEGLETVKAETAEDAWKAREVFFTNEHIAAFHAVSKTQVQVNAEWRDEDTGLVIPIKALLDIVPDPSSEFGDTLADFKRTANAEYRSWARTVYTYGLHVQAAFYLDAINAATGLKYRNFEHHIQESVAPWETTHRMLSAEFITIGRNHYEGALRQYCRALKSGYFRGYDQAIVEPESYML